MPTRAQFWLWFHNSEVVLWARLEVVLGTISGALLLIWSVVSQSDVSPILQDPKWISVWAIVNGLITEVLRRRGSIDQDGHLRDIQAAKVIAEVTPGLPPVLSPGDVQGT